MAFPTLLLVLTIIAAVGSGLVTVFVALGLASISGYTRLVRASVLGARNMEYVTAARAVGATNRHIMARHILPNILAPIIIYSTLSTGGAIKVTAGLSFLGLGVRPPTSDWGYMLATGRNNVYDAWWLTIFPGLAIFFVVICVNMLGDGLRDALDPKLRV